MKKRLKVNGALMFLATCLVLSFPAFFLRADSLDVINDLLEIIGFGLVLFGLLLRISSRGYKAEYSKQGHSLVREGPYGLVRNPMYLGIAMIGLGVVLILFQWWAGLIFILIFSVRYILLIFKEEKQLIRQFGKTYQDYISSTPRLLPRIKLILNEDIREILPLRFSWVRKEIGSVVGFIFGILVVESWEDIFQEGVRIYIKEFIGFFLLIGVFLLLVVYLLQKNNYSSLYVNP